MHGFPNLAKQDLTKQRGLSLLGFILALIITGLATVIGIQVVPSVVEFESVKKVIVDARNKGANPMEIEAAFDQQANKAYITSIKGKDLTIVKENEDYVVSFAYDKKIHFMGPVSLLLEFSGSTDP